MRTDSTRIAKEAQDDVSQLIYRDFGENYCPDEPKVYKMKKEAQDAHEAIRPTYSAKKPASIAESLTARPAKALYFDLEQVRGVADGIRCARPDLGGHFSAGRMSFPRERLRHKIRRVHGVYLEGKDEESEEEKEGVLAGTERRTKIELISITPSRAAFYPAAAPLHGSLSC